MAFEYDELIKDVAGLKFIGTMGKEISGRQILRRRIKEITNGKKRGFFRQPIEFPRGIQIEFTSLCNLSCKHCYNNSGLKSKESLSFDLLKQILDEVSQNRIMSAVISGGEPFTELRKLFYLIENLITQNVKVVIVTNGSFLTNHIIERLSKYRDGISYVQVSIDGASAYIHDEFRGQKGIWEKAVKGVKSLVDSNFRVRTAMSVFPANLETLEDYVEMCYFLGVAEVICGPIHLVGRAATLPREYIMDNKNLDIFHKIIKKLQKKYDVRLIKIIEGGGQSLSVRMELLMPKYACLLRSNGEVLLSCILPFVIGNIREKSIKEIWQEKISEINKNPKVLDYVVAIKDNTTKIALREKDRYL